MSIVKEILNVRNELIKRTGKGYLMHTDICLRDGMNPKKLGTAYSSNKIVFNKKALNELSLEDVRKVVIHEFFHIVAFHEYKGERVGHGKKFKDLFVKYGYDKEIGKTKLQTTRKVDTNDFKYTVHCECCGKIIGYRNRKVNVASLRSKCCLANVVFVENR